MVRKIPGKKHHGVKDPAAQKLRRELSIKDKINAPPSNPDIQELPKSLLEMIRLRDLTKSSVGKVKKKKPKPKNAAFINLNKLSGAGPQLPGMKQVDKNLPSLQQKRGESENSFLNRVERATTELIEEVQLETRHSVHLDRNASGKVENAKKRRFVENKGSETERRGNSTKKAKKGKQTDVTLKPSGPLSDEESEEAKPKLDTWYEHIPFGEVAHAPPKITRLPRRAAQVVKKSISDGLLLTPILKPSSGVSMAAKKRQEQIRLDVVEAYRQMKAAKRKGAA